VGRPAILALPSIYTSQPPNESWAASLALRLEEAWHLGEWDATSWTFMRDPDNPTTWLFRCTVDACGGYADQQGLFCRRCRRNYLKQGHPAGFADTFRPARPVPDPDEPRRFSLAGLSDPVRVVVLFALQVYTRGRVVVPSRVTRLLDRLPAGAESLLRLPEHFDLSMPKAERGLFRSLLGALIRDRTAFEGDDAATGDVWDCGLLGLLAGTHRPHPAQLGTVLDFRPVHHQWLRGLVKEFVRSTRPTVHRARSVIQACVVASQGLLARPDGHHPERLQAADMTAVIDQFETLDHDGAPMSRSNRASLFRCFKDVLEFGRRSGLMDHVPGSFVPPSRVALQRVKPQSEDLEGLC